MKGAYDNCAVNAIVGCVHIIVTCVASCGPSSDVLHLNDITGEVAGAEDVNCRYLAERAMNSR